MDNRGYLVNTIDPGSVKTNDFSVATQAVRLRAFGLTGDDAVTIEQQVGVAADGLWAPVFRNGVQLQLDAGNTQHIELITGIYRAIYTGDGDVAVYFETDDLLLDNNLKYLYKENCSATANA